MDPKQLSVSFSSNTSIRTNTACFLSRVTKDKELKELSRTLNKNSGRQVIQINDAMQHGLVLKQANYRKWKGNARTGLTMQIFIFKRGEKIGQDWPDLRSPNCNQVSMWIQKLISKEAPCWLRDNPSIHQLYPSFRGLPQVPEALWKRGIICCFQDINSRMKHNKGGTSWRWILANKPILQAL